jgi:4'-phosphopantetheinyl transferase
MPVDFMSDNFPFAHLPADNTIHVWQIELDKLLSFGVNLDRFLSIEEHNRAQRFVFAKDALHFRLCRGMLRLGLAWYLGTSPREITLRLRWRDKPCLAEDSPVYFNVTHTRSLALIAFTTVGEVGIDVEEQKREVEALEIASSHFTAKETAIIAAATTPEEQTSSFFRIWTRKEAVLKAAGCGISQGLDTIDVSQQHTNLVKLIGSPDEIAGTAWLIRDLVVPEMEERGAFAAAIAAPPGDWSIQRWIIRDEDSVDRLVARISA